MLMKTDEFRDKVKENLVDVHNYIFCEYHQQTENDVIQQIHMLK